MNRLLTHVRSNVIAYLALCCSVMALSAGAYAAIEIPAGSVGARQLRDHSITPVKFDPAFISGSVRYWAQFDPQGNIVAGSRGARRYGTLAVLWPRTGRRGRCVALGGLSGSFNEISATPLGSVSISLNQSPTNVTVIVNLLNPQTGQPITGPVAVAVIC